MAGCREVQADGAQALLPRRIQVEELDVGEGQAAARLPTSE